MGTAAGPRTGPPSRPSPSNRDSFGLKPAQTGSNRRRSAVVYESARGDITLAFAGDTMITRALMPFREERFLRIRDLFHSTQATIANGEMLFHNYENWPTYFTRTY